MSVRAAFTVLALGTGLAACAPAEPDWEAPGIGKVETDAAWANCQRLARERAEYSGGAIDGVDAGVAAPGGQAATGVIAGGRTQDPMEVYDRQKAQRVYRQSMEACMRAKGFVPEGGA